MSQRTSPRRFIKWVGSPLGKQKMIPSACTYVYVYAFTTRPAKGRDPRRSHRFLNIYARRRNAMMMIGRLQKLTVDGALFFVQWRNLPDLVLCTYAKPQILPFNVFEERDGCVYHRNIIMFMCSHKIVRGM
jgi:hypothetical protein